MNRNPLRDDGAPSTGRVHMPGDNQLWKSYEVRRLEDKRWFDNQWYYLVRWAGWSASHDSWIAEEELRRTAPARLKEFSSRKEDQVWRPSSRMIRKTQRRKRETMGHGSSTGKPRSPPTYEEKLATLCVNCKLPIDEKCYRNKTSGKVSNE